MEKRILVVEDDPKSGKLIKELLETEGYIVSLAPNGREGLELFQKNPFPVVITDLEMPVMDGREFISRLNSLPEIPVIFVETVHSEAGIIIDLMKSGVHDYLIKPLDLDDLLIKVHRSFEISELQRCKTIMEKEKFIRLEQQLDWYRFENRLSTKDIKSQSGQALFHNLHTSFSQGIGFGTIVSLGMIMVSSAKKQDNKYMIDEELFNYFTGNLKMIDKTIDTFKEIDNLLTNKIDLVDVTYPELHGLIREIVEEMEPYAKIKEHRFMVSDMKKGHDRDVISCNRQYLKKAAEEIFLNAFKFSRAGTGVVVIVDVDNGQIMLSVISTPEKDSEGRRGIPMEYENIVFEPFYRLVKTSQDEYKTLDFGLGLTLAETIIKKHNGVIKIGNIRDYSNLSEGYETRVSVTITLPLLLK